MEYSHYCMHGHDWVECICYEPDDEEEPCNYHYEEFIHYPTCSCVGVYCEDTGETIRVQCALCCEGAYVTHTIGGYLNSINGAITLEDKIWHLGALLRYIYTVKNFLAQHLSFTYSLYKKCQELENNSKCTLLLMDIRAVKCLIEQL